MIDSMLTTIDNPYSPFDQYDEWYAYDQSQGYYTTSLLARLTIDSSELSEADQELAIDDAIDEIVSENVLGLYIKVTQEIQETNSETNS